MIRVAIVEDDAEVQGVLQEYVRRYTRQYGTEFEVTVFADGVDILEDYRAVYDIIFLDVEMKHLDGMTTAERIRQMDADVILIFITNMAQYAIRGYSVGALDYVLKPVPYFAFSQQLLKAVARLEKRAKHYLTVPVEGGLRRLDTASIYYLESEGHRVHFYTDEGDFSAPGALKAFEEKLADCPFARCNSGYLVNLAQVRELRQSTVQVGPCELQVSRPKPAGHLQIGGSAALTAVMLALTAFAVSNLGFLPGSEINMSIFSIRTLVDFSGVLILTVQHEQLQENALHSELAAMDEVLHRQYEQYKRSKEGINLINRRYHELKVQLARIREEQDQTKQNAAIAAMEQNIRQYEAENKTGNPVLDTLLTAKTMECQQENITITSVADGRMLGFLTIRELCTIVGVALDNAIAAVRAEPDPEKRLIKVAVYSQGGFAMLRFEHYTEAAPALDADGLPKQGSDLKSVRTTVGQHGGSMTLHWENNWCTLRILFPLPKNK